MRRLSIRGNIHLLAAVSLVSSFFSFALLPKARNIFERFASRRMRVVCVVVVVSTPAGGAGDVGGTD